MNTAMGHWILRLGVLLFLLGLLAGFMLPAMENPRMGLTSHLEGVINGIFLLVLGLLWSRLRLNSLQQALLFVFALYGSYVNWLVTLLAGFWGAGAAMMPIAGGGHEGAPWQEAFIAFGLLSLSLGMIVASALLLWGLRGSASDPVRTELPGPSGKRLSSEAN